MCLDTPVYKRRLSDEEARVEIRKVLGEVEIPQVKSWPRMKRNEVEKSKKNWGGIVTAGFKNFGSFS